MLKKLIILSIATLLVGCGGKQFKGSGEYFELSKRNIVYRDLTVPLQIGNENEDANIRSTPAVL